MADSPPAKWAATERTRRARAAASCRSCRFDSGKDRLAAARGGIHIRRRGRQWVAGRRFPSGQPAMPKSAVRVLGRVVDGRVRRGLRHEDTQGRRHCPRRGAPRVGGVSGDRDLRSAQGRCERADGSPAGPPVDTARWFSATSTASGTERRPIKHAQRVSGVVHRAQRIRIVGAAESRDWHARSRVRTSSVRARDGTRAVGSFAAGTGQSEGPRAGCPNRALLAPTGACPKQPTLLLQTVSGLTQYIGRVRPSRATQPAVREGNRQARSCRPSAEGIEAVLCRHGAVRRRSRSRSRSPEGSGLMGRGRRGFPRTRRPWQRRRRGDRPSDRGPF